MLSLRVVIVGLVVGSLACGSDDGGQPIDGPQAADARVDASPPDARSDGLGTVTNVPGSCANGTLPRTSCRLLRVSCPDVADRQVGLRVTDPPTTTTRLGTIVIGTGGGGGGYYENDPVGRQMLVDLSAAGFRLVQREWFGADGWVGGPGGFPALSCRYATLLQYVHDSIHQGSLTEALCATGNAGGASEIAYALATWNRSQILEFAVPTGGPPMGRLDRGCLDATDVAWQAECAASVGTNLTCGAPSCTYEAAAAELIDSAYGGTDCATANEAFRATFLADSAAAPTSAFSYPGTPLHFIFGADDCTEAVPLGLAFASQVTSTKTIEYVAATPNAVFTTTAGANAIRDALIAGCVVP